MAKDRWQAHHQNIDGRLTAKGRELIDVVKFGTGLRIALLYIICGGPAGAHRRSKL